ncbi:MAG TPA: hypothetical protein VD816_16775 [Ohtaekwangia sp.]|nr:hypothetical protein [Ohtaekwangia sp.]
MDNLNKLQVNSDSILLMQEKSGIRSQIVYYLQSSGAYVLDFDPEHSVIHGCCYFGDSGYVDAQDSLVSVATDPYPIDESKFRSFEICGMPNKVIIGMSRINAAAARCKEIKSLAQEINYIDSISYLCKIKEVHMVGDGELQYLNGKLSRLDQGCD